MTIFSKCTRVLRVWLKELKGLSKNFENIVLEASGKFVDFLSATIYQFLHPVFFIPFFTVHFSPQINFKECRPDVYKKNTPDWLDGIINMDFFETDAAGELLLIESIFEGH